MNTSTQEDKRREGVRLILKNQEDAQKDIADRNQISLGNFDRDWNTTEEHGYATWEKPKISEKFGLGEVQCNGGKVGTWFALDKNHIATCHHIFKRYGQELQFTNGEFDLNVKDPIFYPEMDFVVIPLVGEVFDILPNYETFQNYKFFNPVDKGLPRDEFQQLFLAKLNNDRLEIRPAALVGLSRSNLILEQFGAEGDSGSPIYNGNGKIVGIYQGWTEKRGEGQPTFAMGARLDWLFRHYRNLREFFLDENMRIGAANWKATKYMRSEMS
jgi:hypothetical protein